MSISPQARLLRGFAIDFLTAHSSGAAVAIMSAAYRLSIGGHLFDGRDSEYLPATVAQLDQFPGLVVTVHDVVLAPDWAAMRFTEHGVSQRDGAAAAWGGVTLFRLDGGRLAHGWAEEDYFARKRQLKTGVCDAVRAPHPAPWDAPVCKPDAATEAIVRAWLADPGALPSAVDEISAEGPRLAELIAPRTLAVSAIFTAGSRAAFHAELSGDYCGGFPDLGHPGGTITLPIAAIVDTQAGRVTRAQLCADRLGLQRRLSRAL